MKEANGPRGSVKKKRLTEMLSLSGLLGGEEGSLRLSCSTETPDPSPTQTLLALDGLPCHHSLPM